MHVIGACNGPKLALAEPADEWDIEEFRDDIRIMVRRLKHVPPAPVAGEDQCGPGRRVRLAEHAPQIVIRSVAVTDMEAEGLPHPWLGRHGEAARIRGDPQQPPDEEITHVVLRPVLVDHDAGHQPVPRELQIVGRERAQHGVQLFRGRLARELEYHVTFSGGNHEVVTNRPRTLRDKRLDARQIEADRHCSGRTDAIAREQPSATRAIPAREATDDVDAQAIGTIEEALCLQCVWICEDDKGPGVVGQLFRMVEFDDGGSPLGEYRCEQTQRRLSLGLLAHPDHATGNDGARDSRSREPSHHSAPHGVGLVAEVVGGGDDDQRRREAAQLVINVICCDINRGIGIGVVRKVGGVVVHCSEACPLSRVTASPSALGFVPHIQPKGAPVATKANMETSKGTIVLELFPDDAPKTVENFVKLSNDGYYDGLIFHRVIPDFMIQGGCPQGTGTGGPGYQFEDEQNHHNVDRGKLAMANAGPNTNGSQFFIVTAEDCGWLKGKHTVFGEVIEGMDVIDVISAVDRDGRDMPTEPITMTVTIVED